jgi:hypothetical protein
MLRQLVSEGMGRERGRRILFRLFFNIILIMGAQRCSQVAGCTLSWKSANNVFGVAAN